MGRVGIIGFNVTVKSNGEYLSNSTNQGSYHNSTRNILLKWWVIVIWTHIVVCVMVRLSVADFPDNKVLCLRGSAICTVGLLIGLCASFKTSNSLTARWPPIDFKVDLQICWSSNGCRRNILFFRHFVRFCRSYIRSVIMYHMAKHTGIQSIFCAFRQAITSSWGIHCRFSHFLQRLVHACQTITH